MIPIFKVEDITLSGVSTGTDVTVTTSDGQTYFLGADTKLERAPSIHICVEDLSAFVGRKVEIKYILGSASKKVAVKLEIK